MPRITVKNYKLEEDDDTLHVEGWIAKNSSSAYETLERVLAGYKAMWPDNAALKKIHIVKLP